jgi:hypothetical protein
MSTTLHHIIHHAQGIARATLLGWPTFDVVCARIHYLNIIYAEYSQALKIAVEFEVQRLLRKREEK